MAYYFKGVFLIVRHQEQQAGKYKWKHHASDFSKKTG
jgi:hypothetical protein